MQKKDQTNRSKVVVIGGGTGSFVILSGLKKYPVDLTAIVTMMDSGGSSGKLRDELGVLPPGDVRQCLVALAGSSKLLRQLFMYRFEEGDLKGHNFGNIFLSALEKTTGSMVKAIEEIGKILRIQGKVIPVTNIHTELCVELANGEVIEGETHIDETNGIIDRPRIIKAFLKPDVVANNDAITAIKEADFVIIGPGDLYTSIIPNLLVKGVAQTIASSKAKKIFVLNLMTKNGQTTNYTAMDHIRDLEMYIGKNVLNYILVNTQKPSGKNLQWYQEHEETTVVDDLANKDKHTVIHAQLLRDVIIEKDKTDTLTRSIVRHDSAKLAAEVIQIINHELMLS